MPTPIKVGRKERMSFAKIHEVCEMPNLIDVQTKSYKWFVEEGLGEVLDDQHTEDAVPDELEHLVVFREGVFIAEGVTHKGLLQEVFVLEGIIDLGFDLADLFACKVHGVPPFYLEI